MSNGYMIVNGKKVEGRTLSFDTEGLKVDSELVLENNSNLDLKEEKENNKSDKVLLFVVGFVSGIVFSCISGLFIIKKRGI